MIHRLVILSLVVIFSHPIRAEAPRPIDTKATQETAQLFERLRTQQDKGVLFGHQDTSAYGIGWKGDKDRSDIKDLCGHWPAVYGWDLGDIHQSANLDGVAFEKMKQLIIEADARGGLNTLSLHLDNPVTGRSAWDNRPRAVKEVLPGGSRHESFLKTLDQIAEFLSKLKQSDGTPIPLVLRPFHEHNHSWSWWGVKACSDEEFIALWKMTVDHFRKTRQIHHLLYAYSPQDVARKDKYLHRYPGNDYVDVFGLDFYQTWHWRSVPRFGEALSMINQLAAERGKIAALTETGVDKVPNADWWTEYLLKALQHDQWSRKTAWVLVWRNKSKDHHFGPYRGHPSVPDFIKFQKDPLTIFGPKSSRVTSKVSAEKNSKPSLKKRKPSAPSFRSKSPSSPRSAMPSSRKPSPSKTKRKARIPSTPKSPKSSRPSSLLPPSSTRPDIATLLDNFKNEPSDQGTTGATHLAPCSSRGSTKSRSLKGFFSTDPCATFFKKSSTEAGMLSNEYRLTDTAFPSQKAIAKVSNCPASLVDFGSFLRRLRISSISPAW